MGGENVAAVGNSWRHRRSIAQFQSSVDVWIAAKYRLELNQGDRRATGGRDVTAAPFAYWTRMHYANERVPHAETAPVSHALSLFHQLQSHSIVLTLWLSGESLWRISLENPCRESLVATSWRSRSLLHLFLRNQLIIYSVWLEWPSHCAEMLKRSQKNLEESNDGRLQQMMLKKLAEYQLISKHPSEHPVRASRQSIPSQSRLNPVSIPFQHFQPAFGCHFDLKINELKSIKFGLLTESLSGSNPSLKWA